MNDINDYKFHYCTTFDEVKQLVAYCKQTSWCCNDFETNADSYVEPTSFPTILSISFQPGSAWVVPLAHKDSPLKHIYKQVIQYIGIELIENTHIIKIAQNLKFEYNWWRKYNIIPRGILLDTMLAKYLLNEERPHGLKEMVSMFIPEFAGYDLPNQPGDKAERPKLINFWTNVPIMELSKYGALDADLTFRLWIFFEQRIRDNGFYPLLRNLLMMATRVLADVEYTGMYTDRDYLSNLLKVYSDKIANCEREMRNLPELVEYETKRINQIKRFWIKDAKNEIKRLKEQNASQRVIYTREQKLSRFLVGEFTTKKDKELLEPINFGSPKQLAELFFYNDFGFEWDILAFTQNKKTKKYSNTPSLDEENLLLYKKKYKHPFLDQLLELRGLSKLNSTYVVGMWDKLHTNNRIHGSFLIHGTVTGRLSSRNPNLQNIPRDTTASDIKKMFVCPPGRLILQCISGDARIYTERGLIRVDEVEDGDMLIHKNKSYKIDRLINKGENVVYELVTNTGRKLKLTDNHPILTQRGFKELKELSSGDTLFIEDSLVDGNIVIDPLEAYLAGLFYGDGSYSKNNNVIMFATGLDRHELIGILESYFKVKPHIVRGSNTHGVYVVNKDIKNDWLNKYPKNGSGSIEIPDIIWKSSIETKKHFIGGLIDSDGSVNSNRIRYSSKSEKFIDDLLLLCNSVGIYGIKDEHHRETNYGYQDIYHFIIYSMDSISKIRGYSRLTRKRREIDFMINHKSFSQCRTEYIPLNIYENIGYDNNKVYRAIKNGKRRSRLTRNIIKSFLPYTNNSWSNVLFYRYETVNSITKKGIEKVYDITVPDIGIFNPNGVVVHNCDYSQAELRVLAFLAKEDTMMEWFNSGHDIHLATACKKYGVEYKDIEKILNDENHPDFKTWKIRRKQAKCYSPDTEVLTVSGWQRLDSYNGDKIAQYNFDTGIISFTEPENYGKVLSENNYVYKDRNIDLDITEDHKTLFINKAGTKIKTEFKNLIGKRGYIPCSGNYISDKPLITDDFTRFIAMFTADGNMKKSGAIRFGFSKDRKINRCRDLLNKNGFEFTENIRNGVTHFYLVKTQFNMVKFNTLLRFVNNKKQLSWECLTNIKGNIYLQEASNWDSSTNTKFKQDRSTFYTTIEQTADVMQAMGSIYGIRVVKTEKIKGHFRLSYRPNGRLNSRVNLSNAEPYKVLGGRYMYSVTVPDRNLIVRKNGKVVISGNTTNFGIAYEQGKKALAEKLTEQGVETTPDEAEQILKDWFKDFPKVKKYINKQHKLAKEQGYVKTMFGRKRRLQALLESGNTWKEAEALRLSVNAPIQGTASDFALFSSVLIREEIIKGNLPSTLEQFGTVHDSIMYYIEPKDIHWVVPILSKICANPDTKEWFGFEIKGVEMKADFEIGKSWGELRSYNKEEDYTKWV